MRSLKIFIYMILNKIIFRVVFRDIAKVKFASTFCITSNFA